MDQLIDGVEILLQRAAQVAARYLQGHEDSSLPVSQPLPPAELARRLALKLPRQGRSMEDVLADVEVALEHSVRTGHPRFLNQLFGGHDSAGLVGDWMASVVNTSMYTYEAAPVATLMELELIRRLCEYVGFEDGEGVLAPGGSLSNLTAFLTARHAKFPHVKQHGWQPEDRPVMFVSEEAHYSMRRAGIVAGLGLDHVVDVATDAGGRMDPAALRRAIEEASAAGRRPFYVGATSGTTVLGAFDPLEPLADLCEEFDLWLHVDGSYGGSALFSERHRHLLDGVRRADSVTWNPHKMMGVPLACSATLVRRKDQLVATHGMGADYLFHEGQDTAFDLGDRGLQCGRRVDAFKLWYSWQHAGDEGYRARVDRLFDIAHEFRELVEAREGFRIVREPSGTNVCFTYLPPNERRAEGETRRRLEHAATVRTRAALVNGGRFMVNYATIDGVASFRMVATHPGTQTSDLELLLDEIERLA